MFEKFFLNLEQFEAISIFQDSQFLWSPLKKIRSFIQDKVANHGTNSKIPAEFTMEALPNDSERPPIKFIFVNKIIKLHEPFVSQELKIFLEEGITLEPTAIIKPPVYIGKNSEIRQGAYVRGDVIVGEKCVIGHTTEIKNSIIMNHTEAGHFSYIGDSIIGSYVNLGAGVKLANLQFRSKKEKMEGFIKEIKINMDKKIIKTQMEKLGAIIGDFTEIGCNAVTCPGTLLENNIQIFPNINVPKGLYESGFTLQSKKGSLMVY